MELGINSDCNLKCKMCGRYYDDSYNNKHENMTLDMVKKIADEIRRLEIPSVLIGFESECLLHPQIKEIIKIIKEAKPIDFLLITNGLLLTEEMATYLIELEIDRLQISIDAARPETYKVIRGGNLEILERNINTFLRLREEAGKKTPILRLSFCKQQENINEVDEFIDKWSNKVDMIDFQEHIDMSNINDLKDREYKEYRCQDPFNRLIVDYTGDIHPCCSFGYNKYFNLGNINNITLEEAWNGEAINALRDSFITQKLNKVCLNCRVHLG